MSLPPYSFDSPGEFYLQNSLSSNDDTFRRETQNAGLGGAVPREAFVPTSIPRRDNQTRVRSVLTSLLAEGAPASAAETPSSPRAAGTLSGLTSALSAGKGGSTNPLLRRPIPTHANTNTPLSAAAAPASGLKSSLKKSVSKPYNFTDMAPYSSDEEQGFAGGGAFLARSSSVRASFLLFWLAGCKAADPARHFVPLSPSPS